jgi:hypothetical protein
MRHNHQKKIDSETIYAREKALRYNARRLEYIHSQYASNDVPALILTYEKIQITVFTDAGKNPKTGGTVYWSHNYGVEKTGENPKTFRIYKR